MTGVQTCALPISQALGIRLQQIDLGHTPGRDDAVGPARIAEMALNRTIMVVDTLRGEPARIAVRLDPHSRAVTRRRIATAMALLAAAHDAIDRLPNGGTDE